MAEIGNGTGTGYPTAIDTDTSIEVNSPNAGKTLARAEVVNDLASAMIAVQTELGTSPKGTAADVKTFLQVEHGLDGTHGDVTAISVKIQGYLISYGTAVPTSGTYVMGDRVLNSAPAFAAPTGWECIVSGTPGTWKPINIPDSVSGDVGDNDVTLTFGSSNNTVIFNTEITADRAVTLSTTGAYNGARFRIVRRASATGGFNINVGTGPLKALATAGTWCDVAYDGSNWFLSAYGAL